MSTYKNLVETVIQENLKTLLAVNPEQIQELISEIKKAKTIQLYGMGRMQLSVRGFAMRLKIWGLIATSFMTPQRLVLAKEIY